MAEWVRKINIGSKTIDGKHFVYCLDCDVEVDKNSDNYTCPKCGQKAWRDPND